ncbi:MAG: hypothetical protein HZC41_04325 [Chloroflexi bacterium]|nr:hypothetical protein [Chloroflexota bacterium]
MPVHIQWDDDAHTIIRTTGEGKWTWDEYHEAIQRTVQLMKSVNHSVDLIHVRLPSSTMPPGSPMPHYQHSLRLMPPNTGINVFVNASPFARALMGVFMKLYAGRMEGKNYIAASVEEARALIVRERAQTAA